MSTPLSERADRDQSIEYRIQIERRPADHLQHIGGRGLLRSASSRSRVLACTSSNRRDILDRDDGLVGERLDELDLALREGAGLGGR